MNSSNLAGNPSDYDVYLGFWTNWSHGRVQGATLTMTRQSSGLLIAFLAIYIGSTGKSFWRIVCFLLHRFLSSPGSKDGVYHQRQAILRNASSAADGAIQMAQMAQAWRKRSQRPLRGTLPIVACSFFLSAAFALAGIFSSFVTTNNANEVLLSGKRCGLTRDVANFDQYVARVSIYHKRINQMLTYAYQCYSSSNSQACQLYVKQRLPWTAVRNSSCPFSAEMCRNPSGNLMLDTGYLDSHKDFGVNAAPEQRLFFRFVTHCAPLVTAGFSRIHNNTQTAQIQLKRYYYGRATTSDDPFTYEAPVNLSSRNYDNSNSRSASPAEYNIGVLTTDIDPDKSDFEPIAQLNRSDATVMLVFLSALGIPFAAAVDDPWFAAHLEGPSIYEKGDAASLVPSSLHDKPASVLGCAIQTKICNSSNPLPEGCVTVANGDISGLSSNTNRKKTMAWIYKILTSLESISQMLAFEGISAIKARESLVFGVQGPLPINQWQEEVEYWVAASLTYIQDTFIQVVTGAFYQSAESDRTVPPDPESWAVCNNQKIVTTRYSSFNVLGVALILSLGGIIMVLDLSLESLVDLIQKRRKRNAKSDHALLEWKTSSTLQFQRMAHQGLGLGTWSDCAKAIPVTQRGESLGILDISDTTLPFLRRPFSDAGSELRTDLSQHSLSYKGEPKMTQEHYEIAPVADEILGSTHHVEA